MSTETSSGVRKAVVGDIVGYVLDEGRDYADLEPKVRQVRPAIVVVDWHYDIPDDPGC